MVSSTVDASLSGWLSFRAPEEGLEQFGSAGASQARDADHLPAADLERNVVEDRALTFLVAQREASHFQQWSGFLSGGARGFRRDLPAYHRVHQLLGVELGGFACEDELAVSQHTDAIGELENFFQAMGDEDDALAFASEATNRGKQPFDIWFSESAGWLVHDQDSRVASEGTGDLQKLSNGEGKRLHQAHRIDIEIHQAEHASSFCQAASGRVW